MFIFLLNTYSYLFAIISLSCMNLLLNCFNIKTMDVISDKDLPFFLELSPAVTGFITTNKSLLLYWSKYKTKTYIKYTCTHLSDVV